MARPILIEHNGFQFWTTLKQFNTITVLQNSGTGFATVHDYVSKSGRITPETATINFIAKFSVEKLYQKAIEALQEMKFKTVKESLQKVIPELSEKELKEAFAKRKEFEINSMQKTLDGDRSDAQRAAHDKFYINLAPSIKVHFLTQKTASGTELVMLDGHPIADSIMIGMIEMGRTIKEAGEYKHVNSGIPVLISNVIKSNMPRSTKIKYLSLKEDNFSSLSIYGDEVTPDDVAALF